ncbi:hypothetical protein PV11_09724 [Exophiala sideris]|uniref:C2H2-type domain-containing protein n=1 Tax=Exophiala sideris TaxID=1016849 RepID=A0A0D1WS94_9EURO|nr:hypothetical protein PV11_09724 [Exophiala sideris]
MQCIVPGLRASMEKALTMYETRDLDGKDYRVHRDISRELDSSSNNVTQAVNIVDYVHAMHTPAGWQCKVPQCGATFDHEFTIDLHLWAHGLLAKWYCGEPSCRNGSHRGYIDCQSFKDHVAMEHMSSHYSLATARRTPDKDVLVAGLWRYLKLARVPRTTAVDPNSTVEHTTPSSADDDMCKVPDNGGDPLWNRSPSRHVADQLARSAKRAQFAQSKKSWRHERLAWQMFRTVYDMEAFEDDLSPSERVVKETRLDQAFKKQNPSRRVYSEYDTSGYWDEELQEYPGKYLTGVLTGGHKTLRAREARLFDKSSRALRDMLGTNDKDVLWTALSQMLQGLPPALELDIDFVDFDEDFNQGSNNRQSTQIDDTEESNARRPDTKLVTVVVCPWPGCECRNVSTYDIISHFLSSHLNCVWQCPEKGCEYCGYLEPHLLERHRLHCHVGSPLQCGHDGCDQVLLQDPSASRGHVNNASLRKHFEVFFNREIHNLPQELLSLDTDPQYFSDVRHHEQPLPNEVAYKQRFAGGSRKFFTWKRRSQQLNENLTLLGVQEANLDIRHTKTCTGFSLYNRHFDCVDSTDLGLETAMLLFVPSSLLFTVAPRCNYCVHVLSQLSRPHAALPLPFHFGTRRDKVSKGKRKRAGIGRNVNDPSSFLRVVNDYGLSLPAMAKRYKELKRNSPQKIYIFDFETMRRTKKGQPLVLLEVTVRDGNNNIILSYHINEEGVTNAQFEENMRKAGFHEAIIRSARRIRGSPERHFPARARTAAQILRELFAAGLNPDSLWVEYSTGYFDYRCMEQLIETADIEMSVASILPPRNKVWIVCPDFMRVFPGLLSYKLGYVVNLMNPANEHLKSPHLSASDTAVLHDLLEHWVDKYQAAA